MYTELQVKAQRQQTKKERGKNTNVQKASPSPKGASAESAVAATVSAAAGPRLTDVTATATATRRPFMRVFTHAIPRILRRGGPAQQQAITAAAAASPPLVTAPPSAAVASTSMPQQSPAPITVPEGRSTAAWLSRRSDTNTSCASDPASTGRTSSSNLQTPASDAQGAAARVVSAPAEIRSGSPPPVAELRSTSPAQPSDVPSERQAFSERAAVNTEPHPSKRSGVSPSRSGVQASHAPAINSSSGVHGSPLVLPVRSLTGVEPAQLACASVACATTPPATKGPVTPHGGQDAVFDSDALPSCSAESPPSRQSPRRENVEAAAVQLLVSRAFARVLRRFASSPGGSGRSALGSPLENHAASASAYSQGECFSQSADSTPELLRRDESAAAAASSTLSLQRWTTQPPTGPLVNAHSAEGSETLVSPAASDVGTDAVSTTGTPSEHPSEGYEGSPVLHAHTEQAALLRLHMMGKKKKFKTGSYVIKEDGSVKHGKRPPAR
jgi:hypothetical protein